MDNSTKYLSRAINILFLYNVIGTSCGLLVGIFLLSMQDVLSLLFPFIALIKGYGFIAFGVLLFNIKPLVKGKYTDPKIEIKLKYIREMLSEGNFSDSEQRKIWRDAITSISKELIDDTYKSGNNNDLDQNISPE